MFKLSKEILEKLESLDFKIEIDEQCVTFYRASSAGQDFSFMVEHENDIDQLVKNIENYYENFDVSSETYLWLDEDGHGKNGAPHDMIDVYRDMEECEEYIKEAGWWIDQLSKNRDMPSIEDVEDPCSVSSVEDRDNNKFLDCMSR